MNFLLCYIALSGIITAFITWFMCDKQRLDKYLPKEKVEEFEDMLREQGWNIYFLEEMRDRLILACLLTAWVVIPYSFIWGIVELFNGKDQ